MCIGGSFSFSVFAMVFQPAIYRTSLILDHSSGVGVALIEALIFLASGKDDDRRETGCDTHQYLFRYRMLTFVPPVPPA